LVEPPIASSTRSAFRTDAGVTTWSGVRPAAAMPTAAAPVAALDVDHGCEGPMPSSQQPVCAVHCSHGDVSADSARIPPVPPMLSAPGTPWSSLAVLANRVDVSVLPRIASSPPVSWHRPTVHPAALLLI
jgi:hypothetical protein